MKHAKPNRRTRGKSRRAGAAKATRVRPAAGSARHGRGVPRGKSKLQRSGAGNGHQQGRGQGNVGGSPIGAQSVVGLIDDIAPLPSHYYIDAAAFTRLFRARTKFHSEICQGLSKIVLGVQGKFHYPNEDCKQDVVANTLEHLIRRIDRFDRAEGDNAFSYYTTVAFRSIKRELARYRVYRSKAIFFTDVGWASERPGTMKPYTHAAA